jgi:hypothetical protein
VQGLPFICGFEHARFRTLAHDQHGDGCVMRDVICDATYHPPAHPRASVTHHHDEIRSASDCCADNYFGRRPKRDMCLNTRMGKMCGLGDVVKVCLGLFPLVAIQAPLQWLAFIHYAERRGNRYPPYQDDASARDAGDVRGSWERLLRAR